MAIEFGRDTHAIRVMPTSFEEKLARQRQIAHATGTSPMSQLRNPPPPPAAPKPSPLAKKKKVSPPRRGPPTTKTRIQQMEQSNAAQRVQAIHRGRQTRTELQNKQVAAQRVQAIHRGRSQRLELKEQKQAATRVQAIRRGTSQRKIYLAGGASRVVVCGSAWSGRTVAAAALATKLAVPLVSVGELLRASSLPADGIVLSCGAARILPFVVVLMLLLLLPPLGAGANAVAPVALLLASTAGRGLPSELGLLDGGLPREGGWIIRGVSCCAKLTSLFRPPGRPLCKNNRMHSASVKKNKTDERNSNIDGNGHSSAESMLNGGGGGGPGGGNGVE